MSLPIRRTVRAPWAEGHTEGHTAFTVHSATAQPVPLPVSLHCLGTIPAGRPEWALVQGHGWCVLSCHPPVVSALSLSLVFFLLIL